MIRQGGAKVHVLVNFSSMGGASQGRDASGDSDDDMFYASDEEEIEFFYDIDDDASPESSFRGMPTIT